MNRTLTVEIAFVCMVSLCHADIAKFTVSVIDDITGEPMKDVEVTAGFGVDAGWKAWTESAPIPQPQVLRPKPRMGSQDKSVRRPRKEETP